jgi:hypothetical protein
LPPVLPPVLRERADAARLAAEATARARLGPLVDRMAPLSLAE